ncbi:MAG: hypothetical protein A3F83_05750 [Candidatus Glassbacteria bacterium RIFCSPLOWO2_12_FULL_58_11]|uniref:Uncharacterized protein n=2 Tax=Candidatus Glassiibacteriota TaxID=1817805 RepID=A0A1F5YL56_9BACT|nr:MAG: hypothetical protein A2Z86_08350 [Candidatus Glassbacteria bacterium GWA2_58_10]OGG00824.1 MAG: hypothetical protein A3F83_05750 [Candidatus Glassbacteria bacterium RIFCSPLOWO2_12_FULL_58_11]
MQSNILKISFLMSYLTMLICVVSGIPFVTSLFRSIILMAIFSLAGLLIRWWMLRMISGLGEEAKPESYGTESYEAEPGGEEDYSADDTEYENNLEQSNNG